MINFITGLLIGSALTFLFQYVKKTIQKKKSVIKVTDAEPPRATIATDDKETIVKKYAPIIDELRKRNASETEIQQAYANMNAEIKEKIIWSAPIAPKPPEQPRTASYKERKALIKSKYQVLMAKATPSEINVLRSQMRDEMKTLTP